MAQAINTMVFGSPDTCVRAADGLTQAQNHAHAAGDKVDSARGLADSTWEGPAHDDFDGYTSGLSNAQDSLADTAANWGKALRDFAGVITSVQAGFKAVLAKAVAGGLPTSATIIMAPTPPAVPPGAPDGPFVGPMAAHVAQKAQQDTVNYNNAVDAYNTKIALFNDLQQQARDLRNREDQAHNDLREALSYTPQQGDDMSISLTTVATGRSIVGSFVNQRAAEIAKMDRIKAHGEALETFTSGRPPTAREHTLIMDVMKQEAEQEPRVRAALEWDKYLNLVPQGARDFLTKHPGQARANVQGTRWRAVPTQIAKTMKGVSYLGAAFTVINEGAGALRGEQTWTKAGTDTVVTLGSGAIGGRIGSFIIGGITGGPAGAISGGIIGGTSGNMLANDIVKGWNQGKAEHAMDKYWQPLPTIGHTPN